MTILLLPLLLLLAPALHDARQTLRPYCRDAYRGHVAAAVALAGLYGPKSSMPWLRNRDLAKTWSTIAQRLDTRDPLLRAATKGEVKTVCGEAGVPLP